MKNHTSRWQNVNITRGGWGGVGVKYMTYVVYDEFSLLCTDSFVLPFHADVKTYSMCITTSLR